MGIAQDVANAIDKHIEENQEDSRRGHLGASVIGKKCDREVWYNWRWVKKENHSAQLLRLFNRGHLEEERFVPWLNAISDGFLPEDPETGKQWKIKDLHGYFAGSLDGIIVNPCGHQGKFLTEFKTHNDDSFTKLGLNGVKVSKPEHYYQMQIYLKYKPELKGALYFAVNKNNDFLYVEFVERDEDCANEQMERVKRILLSKEPPERMEGAHERFYYCKSFCKLVDVCFKEKDPHKSCRSCRFVKLTDAGLKCIQGVGSDYGDFDSKGPYSNSLLGLDMQREGCEYYERGF